MYEFFIKPISYLSDYILGNEIRQVHEEKIKHCFSQYQRQKPIDMLHHQRLIFEVQDILIYDFHREIRAISSYQSEDNGQRKCEQKPPAKLHSDKKEILYNAPGIFFSHHSADIFYKNTDSQANFIFALKKGSAFLPFGKFSIRYNGFVSPCYATTS